MSERIQISLEPGLKQVPRKRMKRGCGVKDESCSPTLKNVSRKSDFTSASKFSLLQTFLLQVLMVYSLKPLHWWAYLQSFLDVMTPMYHFWSPLQYGYETWLSYVLAFWQRLDHQSFLKLHFFFWRMMLEENGRNCEQMEKEIRNSSGHLLLLDSVLKSFLWELWKVWDEL